MLCPSKGEQLALSLQLQLERQLDECQGRGKPPEPRGKGSERAVTPSGHTAVARPVTTLPSLPYRAWGLMKPILDCGPQS